MVLTIHEYDLDLHYNRITSFLIQNAILLSYNHPTRQTLLCPQIIIIIINFKKRYERNLVVIWDWNMTPSKTVYIF